MACQSHLTTFGYFPDAGTGGGWPIGALSSGSGGITRDTNGVPTTGGLKQNSQGVGWMFQILPFIEQTNLWKTKTSQLVMGQTYDCDHFVAATMVPNYMCPSRGARARVIDVVYSGTDYGYRAESDYAGNGGTTGGNDSGYGSGNGQDAPITRQDIPNAPVSSGALYGGSSVIVLLGEKCLNADDLYDARGDDDCGYTSGWDPDTIRWGYCPPMPDYHAYKEALGAGIFQGGTAIEVEYYDSFGSSHPVGSNFAMCDGSVRSISYNINPNVFFFICSRDIRLTTQPKLPPLPPESF